MSRLAIVIVLICAKYVTSNSIGLRSAHIRLDEENIRKNELKDNTVLAIIVRTGVLPDSDKSQQNSIFAKDNSNNDNTKNLLQVDNSDETLDDVDRSDKSLDELEDQIQDIQSNKPFDKGVLRDVWKGCNKKAFKICTKACRSAYKNACSSHDCRTKLKKSLSRNCKSSCKSKFSA